MNSSEHKLAAEAYALKEFPEVWIEAGPKGFKLETNIGRRKRAEKDFLAGLTAAQNRIKELEAENRECISRFLHEQRMAQVESSLAAADKRIAELEIEVKILRQALQRGHCEKDLYYHEYSNTYSVSSKFLDSIDAEITKEKSK